MGLTGSFGAGKSAVAQFFKRKGARVLASDRIAHEVFRKGNPVRQKICSLFGDPGALSRRKLAQLIFKNRTLRKRLESMVHPYVFRRIREEFRRAGGTAAVFVVEVPLLFESGFDRACDRTVVVRAARGRVIQRLRRRKFSKAEIVSRWKAQMPEREKVRRADYVVANSGSRAQMRASAEKVWNALVREKKGV